MKFKKILTITLMFLLLSSCILDYHYSNGVFSKSYKYTRLSNDYYKIRVSGNAFTNKKRAIRYAAEVAKENGYRYFNIINTSSTKNYTAYNSGTETVLINVPSYEIEIKLHKNSVPDAYDVDAVLGNISS